MTTERKLLPLPPSTWGVGFDDGEMQDYARANMAPLEAEIARLREVLSVARDEIATCGRAGHDIGLDEIDHALLEAE